MTDRVRNSRFIAIAALAAIGPIFNPVERMFDLDRVPHGMSNEVTNEDPKEVLKELHKTFETFKVENNARDKEIEKHGKATNAATTRVENLNSKIDELQASSTRRRSTTNPSRRR